MNTVVLTEVRSPAALLRDVVSLFKLRIGVLITITALAGYVVTPGHQASAFGVLVLALATLVASAAAGAFNQWWERDSDRLMARTRGRAFVTGALPQHPAWLLLMAVMAVGALTAAALVVNPLAAFWIGMGAFFYAIVYTVWLKRRTWLNIVIGGLSGSFAVLAGAAASSPDGGPLPWLFAWILFLWTPPHFWSLAIAGRADYAAAGIPMLPVVVGDARAARIVHASTWLLVLSSLLPAAFGAGPVYLVCALAGGAFFLQRSARLARAPDRSRAIQSFLGSLVQLSAVLVGACLDVALR